MEQIRYPAEYLSLEPDEMVYLEGGGLVELFDKVVGVEFEKKFLKSFQNAAWNCLAQESAAPAVDWLRELWHMSLVKKAIYIYGGYLVVKNTITYWKK